MHTVNICNQRINYNNVYTNIKKYIQQYRTKQYEQNEKEDENGKTDKRAKLITIVHYHILVPEPPVI